MFSQACVIHSVNRGGVCIAGHMINPPPRAGCRPPPLPLHTVNERAVRILLECILVVPKCKDGYGESAHMKLRQPTGLGPIYKIESKINTQRCTSINVRH